MARNKTRRPVQAQGNPEGIIKALAAAGVNIAQMSPEQLRALGLGGGGTTPQGPGRLIRRTNSLFGDWHFVPEGGDRVDWTGLKLVYADTGEEVRKRTLGVGLGVAHYVANKEAFGEWVKAVMTQGEAVLAENAKG